MVLLIFAFQLQNCAKNRYTKGYCQIIQDISDPMGISVEFQRDTPPELSMKGDWMFFHSRDAPP